VTTPGGPPVLSLLADVRESLAALPAEALAEPSSAVLLAELTGHLIHRLSHPDAPALVAVTGPTGAGKSTLVNALAGADLSPTGPLRPTTRTPVLLHRAEDARWFPGDRRFVPEWQAVTAVPCAGLPAGVALLDTPAAAGPLLFVADVWVFATTATRYADAAGWATLRSAGGRSGDLAVVLDRVPPDVLPTVRPELTRLLESAGLAQTDVLVVAEAALTGPPGEARLPDNAVLGVRAWLERLGTGRGTREAILHRSVAGSVAALAEPLAALDARVGDPRLHRAIRALGAP